MSHVEGEMVRVLIDVVSLLFLVGIVGCGVVVLITLWEDLKTLHKDEALPSSTDEP